MASRIPVVQLAPDYTVPRIIIGGWQLSEGHSHRSIDRQRLFSTFDRCIDLGLNTFDCADIYTGVEELFGEFLGRRRLRHGEAGTENIRIHTKFVPDLNTLDSITSSDVTRIVDRSRKRLGVDRLDMVQFAWWDYGIHRYVDVGLWLTELQQLGWIELIGATNFDARRLAELLEASVPITVHQLQYSVLDQRPRGAMTDLASEYGIWLACYGTLAGGFLSNRWAGAPEPTEPFENRSMRKYKLIIEEFGGWTAFQDCLATLGAIADKYGVRIASVATRYTMDRNRVASVILGTRSGQHLDTTLETCRLQLDEDDVRKIDEMSARAPGPNGGVFELERDREGPHGRIMRYNLNAQ